MRFWIVLAGLNGGAAVAAGAFAAHGFGADGAQAAALVERASDYQMFHALALGLVAVLAGRDPGGVWRWWLHGAGAFFLAGIGLFCGALYANAAGLGLGAMAPFGGTAFVVGWLALAVAGAALRRKT